VPTWLDTVFNDEVPIPPDPPHGAPFCSDIHRQERIGMLSTAKSERTTTEHIDVAGRASLYRPLNITVLPHSERRQENFGAALVGATALKAQ
jgi:hypothetical protein